MVSSRLHPRLAETLRWLARHPIVRQRLAAPPGRTVVYSGGQPTPAGVMKAWELLARAKASDPARFDVVTLEERLRQFHVVEFGETLYEHACRVSAELEAAGRADEAMILWRALSGIYVQGARGPVRMLILPGSGVATSVFALTEVSVLLRPDVLAQIEIDAARLREFRLAVRSGLDPAPIVVM